jgi:hypothetical protein
MAQGPRPMQCNLPFQCAHGRPSLVPVIDLDEYDRRHARDTQRGGS